jgi:glycosyltransferase EpsF
MTAATAPVRVLQVVGRMNIGGAETMLMNLYRAVDRNRLQFDFVVFSNGEGAYDSDIRELGGRIFTLPAPREAGMLRSISAVRTLIATEGPFAAVHSHVLHASGWVMVAGFLAGVPRRLAHCHSTSDVGGHLRRAVYERGSRRVTRSVATHWVACGLDAGSYMFGPSFSSRGVVLKNAIQVDPYLPDTDAGISARRELGVSDGTLLVGSVARLEAPKNHEFLLRVAEQCRGRGLDVHFAVVGDGDLRGDLEREVARRGLRSCVSFLGVRRDVPRLLNGMDLLAMPSHYEGLPVSLVEAQCNGVRCLVSDRITADVDLDLGLLTALPITDPGLWTLHIASLQRERRPCAERLRTATRDHGYSAEDTTGLLYQIYGVTE